MTNPIVQEAEALGLRIEPAQVGLGETYWRVASVAPATSDEEEGEGALLWASALDEYGKPALGVRMRVAWPGGEEIIVTPSERGEPQEVAYALAEGLTYTIGPADAPGERLAGVRGDATEAPASRRSVHVVWQRAIKKVFSHYVLFGASNDPQTQANLIIALGYILRFKPAFGFRVEEAELAERVTIIGGAGSVSFDVQDRLEQAGCWVYRIEGDGRAIDRVLGELQKSGRPFPG